MKKHSRRRFIITAGAAASAVIAGPTILNVRRVFAAPLMRRDIGALGAADPIITGYQTAVTAMKALPSTDQRSWTYQAAIHGTHSGLAKTAWNTCEHHTYFFWSWHRMYLYYFERIVRKYSGVANWTLPYWNYSSPTQRQLPAPFRNAASSLFVPNPNRPTAWNTGAASLPAAHVNTAAGMALVAFYPGASSSLEGNPHDNVHVDIGSGIGWMGDVQAAAQDPVFYVHHSNMDRLWNLWKAQGGGRVDPLSDAPWRNTPFTFFDENAKQVTLTGCDVLRAAGQLNYTYEGEPTQVNEFCLRILRPWFFQYVELIRWPGPPIELGPDRVTIPIDIRQFRERLSSAVRNDTQTVMLKFDDVESERLPGVVWEVYAGLPAGKEPDPESPFFLGTVTLFSAGVRNIKGHGEFKPAQFEFALDRALATTLRTNADKLELTIVPSGILIDGKRSTPKVAANVKIGRISVAIQNQTKSK